MTSELTVEVVTHSDAAIDTVENRAAQEALKRGVIAREVSRERLYGHAVGGTALPDDLQVWRFTYDMADGGRPV